MQISCPRETVVSSRSHTAQRVQQAQTDCEYQPDNIRPGMIADTLGDLSLFHRIRCSDS